MVDHTCPNCGNSMSFPDDRAGSSQMCPTCGTFLTLPQPGGDARVGQPGPASQPGQIVAPTPTPMPMPTPTPTPTPTVATPVVPAYVSRVDRAGKSTSGLGVASLVLGITAMVSCWIPCVGLCGMPLSGIGFILGAIGLLVAHSGGKTRVGMPIAGTAICVASLAGSVLSSFGLFGAGLLTSVAGTASTVVVGPAVRSAAVTRMAATGDKPGLAAAMADGDERVACEAATAYSQLPGLSDTDPLVRALSDPRPAVREAAAGALGQFSLRDKVDHRVLADVMLNRREVAAVRVAAARALGRLDRWEAMPALLDAMVVPDQRLCAEAAEAVQHILDRDYRYRAAGSDASRRAVVAKIRREWRAQEPAHRARIERMAKGGP